MSQFAIRDGKDPILDELKCQTQLLKAGGGEVIINSSCEAPVYVEDCKTQDVIDVLNNIYDAVDGLELNTENINLNAEQINLNTDEVEQKLDDLITSTEFAQDTFQVEDCEGNAIGGLQNVIKVVQIAKQEASICNTGDISNPIVAAIQAQSTTLTVGKKQDFISWTAVANDTMTIPINKFSTLSMLATKGEFKIENTSNNFSTDITVSSGTISNFIEISEDGVGTTTGGTSVPQGFDTRANSSDMNLATNSFLITCIRPGTLCLEAYKNI